jgi:tetratricopeptide (TPR) repeat protein
LEINPSLAQAHNNLANLLDAAGRPEEALPHYLEALRLKPRSALANANLAALLARLGRFEEARPHFEEAARLAPNDPRPHYLLGKALLRQGRTAEALAGFQAALQRDPNDVPSLTYAARVLAVAPDPSVRNGKLARQLAEQANAITGQAHPLVLDTLAAALAEEGHFAQAAELVRQAIRLEADRDGARLTPGLQRRLALYLANEPCRENPTNLDSALPQ